MDQTPIEDLVDQAMDLLVPGELRPVSRLQRAFKIGYNKALRLHELAKQRPAAMNVNYRLALGEAWSAAMAIYKQGHVNSECTLHSILHAQLVKNLPDCVVLCEPQLQMGSHGTFVPDIVVLRETQVVVVLELKFVPHGYPVYEADISKLRAIGSGDSSATHSLLIDPATGKFVDEPGVVGRDSLLVFAAVGQSDAAAVDQGILTNALVAGGQEELASRFVALLEKVPARP